MTRQVYHRLVGDQFDTSQIDTQYNAMQAMRVWGYLLVPVRVAVRVALVALVIQMVCLVGAVEIRFRTLFRLSAITYLATLHASLVQILWIARQSSGGVGKSDLAVVPDSLAALLMAPGAEPTWLYLLLSRASLAGILWVMLLYLGLSATKPLRRAGVAAATAGTWIIVTLVGYATSMFFHQFSI